jgi:phosphoglycolate phosphatase-like HAD superfamily hydrolase
MSGTSSEGAFQFGAGTVIPPTVRLIILDCFETLVEMRDRSYLPRQGVIDFLAHFATRLQVPVVVLSDGEQSAVEAAVAQAGVGDRLSGIFGAPESLMQLPDGRMIKRLDLVMTRFAVDSASTVFIGDSPLDAEAARHHDVPFVRVPRSEDQSFTFDSLIRGPSRYQSAEFSAVFLDHYLQRNKK